MKRLLPAVLAALVLGCTSTQTPPSSSPVASASSTAVVAPEINEQTRGEIQALLQRQRDANASRQLEAYLATIDTGSLPLRRCATENFDISGRQGVGGVTQVVKIEAYLGYVRGYVQDANGVRRLFFKKNADGKWVQAEPKESELGGEKKTTIDGIQIDYWGIDQDVIDALGKGAIAARTVVLTHLLSDTPPPFAIRFYPTRSASGITGCLTAAYYLSNTPSDPYIRMLRYWFTTRGDVAPVTVEIMTHEWLHWAQDAFSQGVIARLPWWLKEGWPDYAGGVRRTVPCRGTWPTLKQLEDGTDADPTAPPERTLEYYALANTMIEYLYTTHGGKDAYRRLLLGFIQSADPKVTFPKVLNVTPQSFYDDWSAATRKKYC